MSFQGRPRFRPAIQPVPAVAQDGREILVFVDPELLSDTQVVMTRPVGLLVHALLDGTRDRGTFLHDWHEVTGSDFPEPDLDPILRGLGDAFLLEGPRVAVARHDAREAYRALPHRPAAFAGSSYAADGTALQAEVDAMREASGVDAVVGPVRAVLAPHIDPRGGGACHGAAIEALAASPADVFVVLGTAHAGIDRPFALTTHDFETPIGLLSTDRDLVHRLAARSGGGLLDDERAHQTEHSVEFQAAWLKTIHADRPDLRIVPVLVGSQHGRIMEGSSPREDPEVMDFVEGLRELREELGDRVAIVASVDFAHVGPNYGQSKAPDDALLEAVMEADRRLLEHVTTGDPDAWMLALHEEQDARNVCGAAPTWTLLETLRGSDLESRLLRHDRWEIDPSNGSHVSFAAVAWRSEDGHA